MKHTIINAQGLSFKYENSTILNQGSFSVYEGELLAFCQTSQMPSFFLMLLQNPGIRYEGSFSYLGQPVGKNHPIDYSYIAGSDTLIDSLSIVDNLYVFIKQHSNLLYDKKRANHTIQQMTRALELPFDIHQSIDDLTISQKYMLELAKAILKGSRIIILDNISRNCSVDDYAWIANALERYSKMGRTFILLSNEDNFLISKCDRIYFCRGTSIIDLIFNDEYSQNTFQNILYGSHESTSKKRISLADPSATALEISLPRELYDKPLRVHRGELFGIFDLFGTLSEAVYNTFFTAFPYKINDISCNNYQQAVRNGLSIISPHRKNILFDTYTTEENLIFPTLRRISKFGVINRRLENYCSNLFLPKLTKEYDSQEAELEKLKLLFYRCMLTNPRVIVMDNPSLDLDAQQQAVVEELLHLAISSGCAIVLISSNVSIGLPLCNRALILQKNGYIEK